MSESGDTASVVSSGAWAWAVGPAASSQAAAARPDRRRVARISVVKSRAKRPGIVASPGRRGKRLATVTSFTTLADAGNREILGRSRSCLGANLHLFPPGRAA